MGRKTIYSGLTADQKKQVNDFALGIVTKLNKALGGARDQLVQGAIDLGGQIVNGLTGGFSEVWQQAQGLGLHPRLGLSGPAGAAERGGSRHQSGPERRSAVQLPRHFCGRRFPDRRGRCSL